MTRQAKLLILNLVAVDRERPPTTYFGTEVLRRLDSPQKFPEAPKPDVFGRANATPRQVQEVILLARRGK